MKGFIASAIALAGVVSSASAAIRYDFKQVTRSDFQNAAPAEISGTTILDGDRMRVDYKRGSMYGPGSYVLSQNGSRSVIIVNPAKQTFSEVHLSGFATALGSSGIQIANLKSDVKKLDDHPIVAGIRTDHYRLNTSYDMTVSLGNLTVTQSVLTIIDKWTTNQLGEFDGALLVADLRTGNVALDQLLETEAMKIKGFPLRHQVTITASRSDKRRAAATQLQLSPVRRLSSEMVITSLQHIQATPASFAIPARFRSVPYVPEAGQTKYEELSLEPGGK